MWKFWLFWRKNPPLFFFQLLETAFLRYQEISKEFQEHLTKDRFVWKYIFHWKRIMQVPSFDHLLDSLLWIAHSRYHVFHLWWNYINIWTFFFSFLKNNCIPSFWLLGMLSFPASAGTGNAARVYSHPYNQSAEPPLRIVQGNCI